MARRSCRGLDETGLPEVVRYAASEPYSFLFRLTSYDEFFEARRAYG